MPFIWPISRGDISWTWTPEGNLTNSRARRVVDTTAKRHLDFRHLDWIGGGLSPEVLQTQRMAVKGYGIFPSRGSSLLVCAPRLMGPHARVIQAVCLAAPGWAARFSIWFWYRFY
jgi:hypothetical protein